jgi:hypothetical protein
MGGRATTALVLAAVQLGLGVFVALRPLWSAAPLTGSRLVDGAFAVLFLVRGLMNVKRARKRPSASTDAPR